MNINATLIGELIFISLFIVGGFSYYLGQRKTTPPKTATLIGVLLCLIPLLNIIYLIVLMLKNDVIKDSNINTSV